MDDHQTLKFEPDPKQAEAEIDTARLLRDHACALQHVEFAKRYGSNPNPGLEFLQHVLVDEMAIEAGKAATKNNTFAGAMGRLNKIGVGENIWYGPGITEASVACSGTDVPSERTKIRISMNPDLPDQLPAQTFVGVKVEPPSMFSQSWTAIVAKDAGRR